MSVYKDIKIGLEQAIAYEEENNIIYKDDRDVKYLEGHKDALDDVAKVICIHCGSGGCPFKEDCEVYSDKACIERIIENFKLCIKGLHIKESFYK